MPPQKEVNIHELLSSKPLSKGEYILSSTVLDSDQRQISEVLLDALLILLGASPLGF